jgi:enoyl-CoA hydratase
MSKIRIEHDGPLTVLTLDSPPLNLFDQTMMQELEAAVERLAAEPPRGLLVRAEGRAVSGGVDVHVFDGLTPAQAGALWTQLLEIIHRVERLPAPTVFAAHALCLTAAFEFSLGCDLLLAAESARFGLVETVVGLTPAMGGTQRLAERAGPARARELVMTGELYDAATLERWNVVNRVLPDDGFDAAQRARTRPPRRSCERRWTKAERMEQTGACPSWRASSSPPRT